MRLQLAYRGGVSHAALRLGSFVPVASGVPSVILAGADPGQDCDDAAALMLLIQRHKAGTAVLLAVTVSPANVHAANTMRILLDYAGLFSIPVGARQANDVSQSDYFNDSLSTYYGYTQTKTSYPAALTVLRTALASAPNASVVIACTGPLPDIYDLLQSPADGIDSRTGSALVQAKVLRFGMIAGSYTPGSTTESNTNEFNLSFDDTQAQSVINALAAMPIDIYSCDGNLGQNTFCGPLDSSPLASNPIKNAYSIFQTNNGASIVDTGTRLTRASWDLIISDAIVDLGSRYTLARGTMTFSTTNNATSWTQGTGNWCFLVSTGNTASLQAYYNPIFDAFDQGATAPVAPAFTISEVQQGNVVLTVTSQFFTSYSYSINGGSTWTALPTNNTITTLSPATAYNIVLRGSRYSLNGPTATVVYTTKAVSSPTSIASTPGVIRYADFRTVANITPNPPGTSRITAVADTATPAKPWATDLGPAYVAASYFGSSIGALRSPNGDVNSSAPGAYGRVYNDLAELASGTSWAVFLTAAIDADRGNGSRLISIVSSGGQDYQTGGCLVEVPSGARTTIQVATGGSSVTFGGSSSWTQDAPLLVALICTAGSLQFWVNGVAIGSPIAMTTFGTTPRLELLREAGEDQNGLFADLGECVVTSSVPTTANRQYLEGKLSWDSTGSGSLLPTGHPYKTVAPNTATAGPNALGFFANVSMQGPEGGSTYPGTLGTDFFVPSQSDFTYVSARSTGPSRLPFSWERMQPTLNGALDPTYLGQITTAVSAAAAAGTKVFLDCHNYMRRAVFSQTSTAPYTIAGYHGVDNADGVVTRAHLVNLWTKLATNFKGVAGIAGYDIMNEPTSDNAFGSDGSGTSADLAPIMQACVNAIAAVDTTVAIFVEGTSYSSCKSWVSGNASYPLSDPTNQIIYSAHCYPDYDHSGTHFTYAQNASPPSGDALTANSLVTLSTSFVNWCSSNGVKGNIGETNVGIDDSRWNTVLDNGVAYWKTNGISVNLWLYNANFGANPYNLYPYSGSQSLQWAVYQKELGLATPAATITGPSNGVSGTASAAFTVNLAGYLAANKTYTPSSTTAGTFTPTTVTLAAGFNPTGATFTFTPSSTAVGSITVSDGTTTSPAIAFSSNASSPISASPTASPKYSDWSASQGGLTTNSTFATDEEGTNTAVRITDNSSTTQHVFNGPAFSAVPGASFEVRIDLLPSGLKNAAIKLQGTGSSVSVNVDLVNSVIKSGAVAGGAVLTNGSVTAGTNGFKVVRFTGTLAASDLQARVFITALNSTFQASYAGAGNDMYADKLGVYFSPIETVAGPPIANSLPTLAVTSGSPGPGGTYTVTPPTFVNGTPTFAYQWLRDGTTSISGATSASYTATASGGADDGHKLSCQVTATNSSGTTVLVSSSASIDLPWTVNSGNLITTQDPTQSSWTKVMASGDVLTITPNYAAGGFAPDGQSYPTRVQIQSVSGYTSNLNFAVNHAAGYQSLFIRTNPATGDSAAYINLRSSANGDDNLNLDGSSGTGGYPTGAWNYVSAPVALNEPFLLLARPTTTVQDFLIWGERLEVGSTATPYAHA